MKREVPLIAALFALAPAAEGQVAYCKDIGGGKTYCSGGTVIHRQGDITLVPNAMPAQPQSAATLPNPLLQNNALPTMNAPYSAAGTQGALPASPAPAIQPATPATPVIIVPPAGSRVCHQFGTTLVCN
mgnify:CR=1 FL=1